MNIQVITIICRSSLGFHLKCDKLKVNLGRMDTSVIFNLTILRPILILAGFAQWLED